MVAGQWEQERQWDSRGGGIENLYRRKFLCSPTLNKAFIILKNKTEFIDKT